MKTLAITTIARRTFFACNCYFITCEFEVLATLDGI